MEKNEQKNSRYPGVRPFERNEGDLFNGRDIEIKELCDLIEARRFVVLFAKSGTGKTSLLNAGVLPKLDKKEYSFLRVRFQDFDKSPQLVFQESIERFVKNKTDDKNQFLSKYKDRLNSRKTALNRPNILLWEFLKSYDIERIMTSKETDLATKTPVIIFDQFEEFFQNKNIVGRIEFIDCLADLLYGRIPDKILDEHDFSLSSESLSNSKSNSWLLPLDWKVIISIRSDRLFHVDELSPQIPAILNNRYGLLPLTREQARQAIILPAEKISDNESRQRFKTAPFNYLPDTLEQILDVLSTKGGIESFQLQIICEYIEQRVLDRGILSEVYIDNSYLTNNQETVEEGINRIIHSYYQDKIQKIGTTKEKLIVQKLLEEGLIIAETRVSLPKKVILKKYALSETLLKKVVATRLIREKKIFSDAESVYEIAHDTLVPPILDSLEKRQALEEQERQEQELLKERRKRRLLYFWIMLLLAFFITAVIFAVGWGITNKRLDAEMLESHNLNIKLKISSDSLSMVNQNLEYTYKKLIKSTRVTNKQASLLEIASYNYEARALLAEAFVSINLRQYTKAFNLAVLARDLNPKDSRITQVLTQAYYQVPYEYDESHYAPPFPKELVHKDVVSFADISPDGRSILSCSGGNKTILWDVAKNKKTNISHTAPINRAIFSPNGQNILTCSDDSTARIWNRKGELLQTFQHLGVVNLALFSLDGEKIVTASSNRKVSIWTLEGKLLAYIPYRHTRDITQISFSSNGQKVLINTHTNNLKLWDWAKEKVLVMDEVSKKSVNRTAFSPDGESIIAICDDGSVYLWDKEGKLKSKIKEHTKAGLGLAFSPNSDRFVSVSMDGTAKLMNRKLEVLSTMKHAGIVLSASFSPNGKYIATTCVDKITRIWDNRGRLITRLYEHQNRVNWVAWNNNNTITTISSDNTVKVWDLKSKPIVTLQKHKAIIHTLHRSNDGSLLSAGQGGKIAVWSKNGTDIFTPFKAPFSVQKVSLSDDQRWLVAAAGDIGYLWNTSTKKRFNLEQTGGLRVIEAVAFSLKNRLAITVSQGGEVKLWDTKGTEVRRINLSKNVSQGLLSPDGNIMVLASNDGAGIISLPKLDTNWVHQNSKVKAVDISPNGKYFATASTDHTAKIWTLSGKLLMNLEHDQEVRDVKFSPNNNYLATASHDKTVKLWNNFKKIPKVLYHPEKVNAVLFSPAGKYLLSIDLKGVIYIWNLQGELLASFNCKAKKGRVVFVNEKRFAVSNNNKILFFDFSSKVLIDQFK